MTTLQGSRPPEDGLRSFLLEDEQILWEGKPEIRAFMLRGWWYLVPFSLLWGGFAIFWEVGVISSHAPLFFMIWGVPFVLLGLYMVFGRFYVAAREAEHTTYALTDRRVLIHGGAFRVSLTEIDLEQLPSVELDETGNGTGTITFGSLGGFFFRAPPGWPTFGTYRRPPAFQSIRDVRTVFSKVQQARADARARVRPPRPDPAPAA